MCFTYDASPPDLPSEFAPVAGGAAAEYLTLHSSDGTEFSAAFAAAGESRGPAVIVFPDVRGLYPFYAQLVERFADAGHDAIAIDYFGRTAGLGPRDDQFDYMPHVRETDDVLVRADASDAMRALTERTGNERFVAVGFCFGGLQSLLAASDEAFEIEAAASFYGPLDGSRLGHPSPGRRPATVRVPLLGLYGGADEAIPTADVEAYIGELNEAGVQNDFTIYPGAPHSFFDKKQEEFADESEDAWRRVLGFLDR